MVLWRTTFSLLGPLGKTRSWRHAGAMRVLPAALLFAAAGALAISNDTAPVDLVIVDGSTNLEQASGVATNARGDIWVSSFQNGSLFGGLENAVVQRFDVSGTERWLVRLVNFGGSSFAEAVALDPADNAYVGAHELVAVEGNTTFREMIATKVTPGGQIAWQQRLLGDGTRTIPLGVAADASGNSVFVGFTDSELEPGAAAGGNDVFLVRYDTAGNLVWVRQYGTAGSDIARGAAFDSAGNLFVFGSAQQGFLGETGPGGRDMFLTRFDAQGNPVWTRLMGTSREQEEGFDIKIVDDVIYVAGEAKDICSCITKDAYVASYDRDGNQLWETIFGGDFSGESVTGLAVGRNRVYAVGDTFEDIDDNANSGNQDLMLLVYDRATGNRTDAFLYGNSAGDSGYAAAIDPADRLVLAGRVTGSFLGQPAIGRDDLLVMRLALDVTSVELPAPADRMAEDRLGAAVAANGEFVAVGMPGDDTPAGADTGRVLIYRITGGGVVLDDEIEVPAQFSASGFGSAVALSGGLLAVGAPGTPSGAKGLASLQAAIFERVNDRWDFKQALTGSAGGSDSRFGASLALDGGLLVVGAPGDAEGEAAASGAVYAFGLAGGQFVELDKQKLANPAPGAAFGTAVAAKGGKIAAGAILGPAGPTSGGLAVLYDRIGDNLAAAGLLTGSGVGAGAEFGSAVSFLSGDRLAVGAPGEDDPAAAGAGAVYVFDFAGSEQARLTPTEAAAGGAFGTALAFSGNRLLIGAPGQPASSGGTGAVSIFDASLRFVLESPAPADREGFGSALALTADTRVIGAPATDSEAGTADIAANLEVVFANGFE